MKVILVLFFSFFVIFGIFLFPQTSFSEDPMPGNDHSLPPHPSDNQPTTLDSEKIMLIYPGKLCGEGTEFKDGLCVVSSSENTPEPHFNQDKIETGYTLLLFLLLIYYIPAQTIERVLEVLDPYKLVLHKRNFNKLKEHDEILKIIRTKKFVENSSYKLTKSDLSLPEDESNSKISRLLSTSSSVSLANVNLSFAQNSVELHREKIIRTASFFIVGCLLAIVPSWLMVEFGLGPMYIVDNILNNKIPDKDDWFNKANNIIINILFIASGTQPIHKLIELIPKVRKSS